MASVERAGLKKIHQEYTGDIIVPMTVYNETIFADLIGELRRDNIPLYHFQLEVSNETIITRLQERDPESIQWGISRVDEIITGFERIPQREKIVNEERAVEEVVGEIMKKVKN